MSLNCNEFPFPNRLHRMRSISTLPSACWSESQRSIWGREVLIPIALALLLSFLLTPAMVWMQRWGLGKTFAALLVILLTFVALAVASWIVAGQGYNLAIELPQYRQNIQRKLHLLNPHGLSKLNQTKQILGEVSGDLARQGQSVTAGATSQAANRNSRSAPSQRPIPVKMHEPEPTPFQFLKNATGSVLRPLATAFIVLIFVIFILLGREDLRDRLLRLAGSSRLYVTTQALDDAARRVSRYLLFQLAVNSTFGSLVGLGLFFIGIPHAVVWAVLATLLRFIPYVGPWLGAVPWRSLEVIAIAWTIGILAWCVSWAYPQVGTKPLIHTGGRRPSLSFLFCSE